MKNIFILILFILSCNAYSQNVYHLIKPYKNIFGKIQYPITIQKVTTIQLSNIESAVEAAYFNSEVRKLENIYIQHMKSINNTPIEFITQNIRQFNCSPENLYGGYNYLITCSRILYSKSPNILNSVRLIININLLKYLHQESIENYNTKEIYDYPFLDKFIINSPALLIPSLDYGEYNYLLNNNHDQINIYKNFGIKGILDIFFKHLNIINKKHGSNALPEYLIKGTYLEAKVWCNYYGLKWE